LAQPIMTDMCLSSDSSINVAIFKLNIPDSFDIKRHFIFGHSFNLNDVERMLRLLRRRVVNRKWSYKLLVLECKYLLKCNL
jgi:hypothetical protein